MAANLLKSTLHNVGVVIVGLGVAYLGRMVDLLFGISAFVSPLAKAGALLLLVLGFLVRLWATFHFYVHNMRVISLEPQTTLITSGPYRFSRNPLYLGGNVFIFFGAALLLGSPMALVVTALHIPLMDRFIRREESNWSDTSATSGGAIRGGCVDGSEETQNPMPHSVGNALKARSRGDLTDGGPRRPDARTLVARSSRNRGCGTFSANAVNTTGLQPPKSGRPALTTRQAR